MTRITIVFFLILTYAGNSFSQVLEIKIHNTTGLPDSLVYVAAVGEDSLLEYFDFKTYKNQECPIQSTDQFHYIGKKNYNEINLNANILIYPNPMTSELNTIITIKHQTTLNLCIAKLNENMVKVLETFIG